MLHALAALVGPKVPVAILPRESNSMECTGCSCLRTEPTSQDIRELIVPFSFSKLAHDV
jgi:hypothetical protein